MTAGLSAYLSHVYPVGVLVIHISPSTNDTNLKGNFRVFTCCSAAPLALQAASGFCPGIASDVASELSHTQKLQHISLTCRVLVKVFTNFKNIV